jgi:hypothetical protein
MIEEYSSKFRVPGFSDFCFHALYTTLFLIPALLCATSKIKALSFPRTEAMKLTISI